MIRSNFGDRIKELRIKKGISQEKFAVSIGMDKKYYWSIEKGKRNVSLESIERIAKGLGVSLETLFKGL